MIRTRTFALALLVAPLFAHADDAAVRDAVKNLLPQAKIDSVEKAPMENFSQVVANGQLVYVSDDGKFVMQGALYDTAAKKDLTEARLAIEHKSRVDAVPTKQRLIFAPDGKAQYKVTVFTDIDCGFCRKLHSQIAEYNKRGIEVDYLFFPRSGPSGPSFDKAVSVWCAKDRKAAFTAAKAGGTPTAAKCDNPVAQQFQLGVDGTPTVFAPDGTRIGGYLAPDAMLEKLRSLAATAPMNKTSP